MTHWLRTFVSVTPLAIVLAMPFGARASLIGDTVNCSATGSLICNPSSAVVVDPGSEFDLLLGDPVIDINVAATTFLLSTIVPVGVGSSPTTVSFTSLGNTSQGAVIGATLNFSDVATFTQSDVSFTADSLVLDLTSTTWSTGNDAQITLLFQNEAGGPGPTPGLPEPSTLLLLAAALLGLGSSSRLKQP